MIAVNYTNLRKNLKSFFDVATNDFETIIVTRKGSDNVVVMSEAEYNNMQENLFVRKNKNDYNRLIDSISQLENCEIQIKELLEDE